MQPRVRRPELGVEVALPTESPKIHARPGKRHAFGSQALLLLAECLAANNECEPAICAHHTMPWQFNVFASVAQNTTDKAGTTRQPSPMGNFSVAGHEPRRNPPDDSMNGKVLRIRHGLR